MAYRKIYNTTLSDVYLTDFGNQLIKATGDVNNEDVLSLTDKETTIRNSTQLFNLVSIGDISVLDANDVVISDSLKGWKWLINDNDDLIDPATGRVTIQQSSRPIVGGKTFSSVWTGAGDDMITPALGEGSVMEVTTQIGVPKSSALAEFHSDYGDVYLHEGYLIWDGASVGDYIDVEVVAHSTPLQTASALDYEMDGSRIHYAVGGTGTGTHGLNGTPVFVPNITNTGYWDLSGTTPVPMAGTGAYDWFDVDVVVNRFFNKIPVFGSSLSYTLFNSSDAILMPPGYFINVEAYNNSDTVWKVAVVMTLYREQTV